jgi:hypothetical protein
MGMYQGPGFDHCHVVVYGHAVHDDFDTRVGAFSSLSGKWLGFLSTVSNIGRDIEKPIRWVIGQCALMHAPCK